MEHLLSNCHGEWNAIFALMGTVPFIGPWFRSKFKRQPCTHEHKE